MKKQLLIILCSVLTYYTLSAQSGVVKPTSANQQNQADNATNRGERAVIKKNKFASSWNANSLLVSASNCLTANQETNLIMFTHRINKFWAVTNVNSGFIQSTYSKDGGTVWDSLLQLQEPAPNLGRFPSGAIFNAIGNTDPNKAFAVVSGSITDGNTQVAWKGNFFASTQLNQTNNDKKILLNADPSNKKQHFARSCIQSTDDKVIVLGELYDGEPDATTLELQKYRGAVINIGKKNGTTFDWTVDSIVPACKKHSLGYKYLYSQALTAWSKNGTIGYVVLIGVNDTATGSRLSYQPIVYKTTTSGFNWTKMPAFDYSAIPSINAKLLHSYSANTRIQDGPKKAFYLKSNGMDAVVDNSGNLHIVNAIASGSNNELDSLSSSFEYPDNVGYIYDTYSTANGWEALLIDSLKTKPTDKNFRFVDKNKKNVSIDARIQASMTTDGTHIFYMWLDSDYSNNGGENAAPDIYGKGWNLSTGKSTNTATFTSDESSFYMYASNVALVNGSTFTIPTTVSAPKLPNTNNTDDQFDHYYIQGIQFAESEFINNTPVSVGIAEISTDMTISQNYPNPFSNFTFIDVTLKEMATVSIEVMNALGQHVLIQNSGKLSAGTHTFTVDGSKLPTGIYFYTVKYGNISSTKKMAIE